MNLESKSQLKKIAKMHAKLKKEDKDEKNM